MRLRRWPRSTYAVYANPPLGNLDQAVDSRTSSVTVQQSDSLMVSGWAADPTDGAPISNLKIYIDGNLIGTPPLRFARADVASYFNNPAYTNSGYQIFYSSRDAGHRHARRHRDRNRHRRAVNHLRSEYHHRCCRPCRRPLETSNTQWTPRPQARQFIRRMR